MSQQIKLVNNMDIIKTKSLIKQIDDFISSNEFEQQTLDYIYEQLDYKNLKNINLDEMINKRINKLLDVKNKFVSIIS